MPEEEEKREEEKPERRTRQYEYGHPCTTDMHDEMRSRSARKGGFIGGSFGILIGSAGMYLLMKNCNGDYVSQTGAGGAAPTSTHVISDTPKDKKKAVDDPCYESLQAKLGKCQEELGKYKGLLEACNKDLENCIEERDEYKKRPESCPTYTPKACPPVKECPELPYIRKGD